MPSSTLVFAAAAVLYFFTRLLNMTDKPKIKGLPEVSGIPLFGNLLQLGDSHAKSTRELAKTFGPVFQTRLGYKRIIFVNSFEAVRELWITNQSALISRPTLYTFKKLSSSEGLTLGSSPWDASLSLKARSSILRNPEASMNEAEIMSLSLSVVAAGLETVSLILVLAMAYLSSPKGQSIQTRPFREIMAVCPEGDAWEQCLHEEKVPYMVALFKEILRYWTVGPLALPRASTRDIHWNGAVIPAGSFFYMNAYAAHHDEDHYKEPYDFNPDRFSNDENHNGTGIQHFGFGAGSRMCPGSHLADKELYTALVRIILAYEIQPSKELEDRPILGSLECNMTPSSLTIDPKPFKVGLKVRNRAELDRWIGESEQRTADL